ncbi:hypothetical protein F4821DRAFT_226035 [Hypoxylon rubiginosum]|uniref:Uncharacterized protein n=1 Tax=Hypoxylon rubiginosum TaxID=110542 RepID=A0ACC0DFJ7_9PEZI|nr:hypothetical protein F4821DRAFT_226035 [Hypoxylon rubiginosum]
MHKRATCGFYTNSFCRQHLRDLTYEHKPTRIESQLALLLRVSGSAIWSGRGTSMADARALLRAHRAENRIKHDAHATYSNAGQLLCKLCHESVKSEALWEGHIRSLKHAKRLRTLQAAPHSQPQPTSTADRDKNTDTSASTGKRKYDDLHDVISDAEDDGGDAIRKKRSKTDIISPSHAGEKRQTPPALGRRTSSTPAQGVEIAIPSRPATPAAGSNSTTSTPKAAPVGRSPLIGSDAVNTPSTLTPTTQANLPISTQSLPIPANSGNTTHDQSVPPDSVDEAEWAAFEAEMATTEEDTTTRAVQYSADATISAPALTVEQIAAKSHEEENERRKHLLDTEIADEREDATRALEAEFEEMEELEGRVRRLKERREELRKGSLVNLRAVSTTKAKSLPGRLDGSENSRDVNDEEEDDDDDGDDDWDAFRFR